MFIEVVRARPPEIGRCRGNGCGQWVEWVTTKTGRRMPVTSPLLVEREQVLLDGSVVTVIDSARSHFVDCPAAGTFRRRKVRR